MLVVVGHSHRPVGDLFPSVKGNHAFNSQIGVENARGPNSSLIDHAFIE